jgi:hypothetical protein
MADQLQLRGGTTNEHSTFTGALREVTVDTDKDTLIVHDAATAGGHPLLREDGSNSALSLGTAGTPSLKFTGDANTGIYSPGADQVAISTGGSGRLFVNANGNVGIGSTSTNGNLTFSSSASVICTDTSDGSDNKRLVLNGGGGGFSSGRGGYIALSGNEATNPGNVQISMGNVSGTGIVFNKANGTPCLNIDSDGKVGVGTSDPGSYSANNLVIAGTGARGLTIASTDSNNCNIYFADGTAGSSAFRGIIRYSHNDDYMRFFTSGGEALVINSSGRVGIGTTSPSTLINGEASTAELRLKSTGASNSALVSFVPGTQTNPYYIYVNPSRNLIFQDNSTERARIDSSGRLLVGTSSSSSYGNSTGLLQISGTTNAHIALKRTTDNSFKGTFTFAKSRGTVGSETIVNSGDSLGAIQFAGYDGTDYDTNAAEISCVVDGTPGANDMPGRLVFSTTADGASSPTERMRIDSSGRVGIGTTSPTFPLQVETTGTGTTAGSNGVILVQSQASGRDAHIRFGDSVNATARLGYLSNSLYAYVNGQERARIDSSGRLGLGTSSPAQQLHVRGSEAAIRVDNSDVGANVYGDILSESFGVLAIRSRGGASTHGKIDLRTWDGTTDASRLFISTTGNVGIGTTSPSSILDIVTSAGNLEVDALGGTSTKIRHTTTGGILALEGDAGIRFDINGDNEKVRIDSSGRLLVGTSSAPSVGIAEPPRLFVSGHGTNATKAGSLGISRGAVASSNNQGIGNIQFTDSGGGVFGTITCTTDGTPGTDDYPGRLVFSTTADGASSPTERMRITSGGQLRLNLPSNTTSRHIGIVNDAGTIGWTFGNGITSATRQFVVYDNEAGAARTVIDSSGNFKFNSGYGSAATAYGVRAWVNFNGSGTISIRESGNVGSITDEGTGDYRINFTNAMPDNEYAVAPCAYAQTGASMVIVLKFASASGHPMTSSWVAVVSENTSGRFDSDFVTVSVIR